MWRQRGVRRAGEWPMAGQVHVVCGSAVASRQRCVCAMSWAWHSADAFGLGAGRAEKTRNATHQAWKSTVHAPRSAPEGRNATVNVRRSAPKARKAAVRPWRSAKTRWSAAVKAPRPTKKARGAAVKASRSEEKERSAAPFDIALSHQASTQQAPLDHRRPGASGAGLEGDNDHGWPRHTGSLKRPSREHA